MKYFTKLDLDWKPFSEELRVYLFEKRDISKMDGWVNLNTIEVIRECPSLIKMIAPLESMIHWAAVNVHHDTNYSAIHIDADIKNISRLLIPILNCEDSETCFYTCTESTKQDSQPNGVPFHRLDAEKCQLVDKLKLNEGAYLFRVKEPHNVIISKKSKFPRISCTISLTKDLTYLLD